MDQKSRIKRLDKIGSTAYIPYSRTISDIKSQRWIADRFYRLMGRTTFFWDNPEESIGSGTIRGQNFFDLKETASRIKCIDEFPKENIRTADQLERLGKRAKEAGHRETALDYYFRACHFYVSAAWGIFDSKNEELIWLSEKIKATFDEVIENNWYPMERVEIPFEGRSIPGILSLTPNRGKAPTVLFVPGMDLHKENGMNYIHNPFVIH